MVVLQDEPWRRVVLLYLYDQMPEDNNHTPMNLQKNIDKDI